ncbi:MAG TPA: nitroreductase family protein [Aggregatilineales bacterium]|nr:nitroreductase family protein [Aggregatilineales bacterium]
MNFPDLIRTRRSIRRYDDRPVPHELLAELLELAKWSPSAHNRQPWRFAVVSSADTQHRLAVAMGNRLRHDLSADGVPPEVIENDANRSYTRITGAATLICLCLSMEDMDTYPDEKRNRNEYLMAVQSTAMAGQNLLLAAHHAGLGACWMCAPLFCPEVVREALQLPKDWEPQALITLGYPAEERHRERRSIEEMVLWL